MKRFFGKKQVLIATLAVALGLAVYLNYYLAQTELKTDTANGAASDKTTVTTVGGNLGDSQYVNGTTTLPNGESVNSTLTEAPYFKQARENRAAARAESLQVLQEMVNDVNSSQAVIDDATQKILAVAQAGEQESKIESLVKAKGFTDCVAYIEGDNCNVVVQAEGLTAAQTLQITEIITAQSAVKSENIKISSINS